MGWNTWCTLGNCGRDYCDEEEVRAVADAMVESGMASVGFEYVLLDDCWGDGRDAEGNIYPDPARFPSGMQSLADYVHSKGLKLGLYTDAGLYTCSTGGRDHQIPGSYGHYQQDANTYASWGIDYVKMDWCNTNINGTQLDPRVQYPQMTKALNATDRPIFFSMCEWGLDNPWTWASPYGNAWRTGQDHHDDWGTTSIIIENNSNLSSYAGPGGWNDPDFLMTGGQGCEPNYNETCPGMTQTEYITEFSIWCILSAPLIVATEIRQMTPWKQSVLLNTEVIAVNQDPLAQAGGRISFWPCNQSSNEPLCEIWAKELYNGSYAVVLYNSDSVDHNMVLNFWVLNWENESVSLRDLWAHQDLGTFTGYYSVFVASHGVVMLKAAKT